MSNQFIPQQRFNEIFSIFNNEAWGENQEMSFQKGLPKKNESYKNRVYFIGKENLNSENWKEEDIGSKKIIESVISAIEITDNNLCRNNPRYGPGNKPHCSLYDALDDQNLCIRYEKILYDFYCQEKDPEKIFNSLIEIAGRKYNFIAYLFFLKNKNEYVPIASRKFDESFEKLGVNHRMAGKCSWGNYTKFIEILKEIQGLLKLKGIYEATLLDAHSFCWMINDLKNIDKIFDKKPSKPSFEHLKIDIDSKKSELKIRQLDLNKEKTKQEFIEENIQNIDIGNTAEAIVFDLENDRLIQIGRSDLAKKIENVSEKINRGYDILSYNEDGSERYIEVKSVRSNRNSIQFFVSPNELEVSQYRPNYFFYFVTNVKGDSKVFFIESSELEDKYLTPSQYRAEIPIKNNS